jgi:hypothetical protein
MIGSGTLGFLGIGDYVGGVGKVDSSAKGLFQWGMNDHS